MDILNMLRILYFAFTFGVILTPFATAAPLCQSHLVATTQRGSAEGSAKILFLCEGVVVHELPGFSTPAYSPNRKFIIMHDAEADDDTQLYLFPTNENGLPDYKRSIGAFGGRYSRFIAWNQNSKGFFLFCWGATDQPTGLAKNSAIITLSQRVKRWQASLRVILDWMGPSKSVLSLTPIPGSRISISLWPAKADYIRGVA
jgi:hypothetical protein